jgi:para-nitrobenzyl esterase
MSVDVAATEAGLVRGVIEDSGVTVFRGVPFAAPPVGDLRFAPPAPTPVWEGERLAIEFGPTPIQNVDPLSLVMPGAERNYYAPRTAVFSEDCLYLNVFTPAVDGNARPVMVWIHGGGFVTGSGGAEWYDGTNLAVKNDVVVVTINYRLGILGGLYLGDHDPDATNFGIRDQIAALEWVRRNISEFGGDPANVTVFGQSAGGMAVSALLVSPLSAGLFHRVIIQSGNVAAFVPQPFARETTQNVLDALGIDSERAIEELRDVSTLRLLEVQRTLRPLMFPALDDVTIPSEPLDYVREGRAADVPMLIGNTAAENKLFHLVGSPRPKPGFDLRAGLERILGPDSAVIAAEGAALYRASSQLSDAELWDQATSDVGWILPSRRLADAHASAGRATFTFEFAVESTALDGIIGAAHEVDVPFVFDVLDKKGVDELLGSDLVADPAGRKLAEDVAAAWASFARDGRPALRSIAEWPEYREGARTTVLLDLESTISLEHRRERLDFWEAHSSAAPIAVVFLSPDE